MRWIALGGLTVLLLISLVWGATVVGNRNDAATDTARADAPDAANGQASVQPDDDDVATDDEEADAVTSTTASSSTSTVDSTSTTASSSPFAARDAVYGRYVAILWSDFGDINSIDFLMTVESRLADEQARFGANVIAIDSNLFRSLRDGTVAVVFDGGFASARDAKSWCRANGFPGTQDCFGAVLSDDFSPDQRGEFVRVYDI